MSSLFLGKLIINFSQESSEFHKRSFESAVDSVQAIAASHLWQVLNINLLVHVFISFWSIYVQSLQFPFPPCMQLVVVRADLNGHLKALKDYFLLAKGDFFQVKLETSPVLTF